MNDATLDLPHDVAAWSPDVPQLVEQYRQGKPLTRRDAGRVAVFLYSERTGQGPNDGQLQVLMQQVRNGYIDGKPANIVQPAEHSTPADRRARAEAASERMDGMTIAEAAAATGHSSRAIRGRVDRGTLRAWKGPDGKRRIPRADLISAGLLVEPAATPEPPGGSGTAASDNAANTAPADMTAFALTLWEKAEQAMREAAEHRLLAAQADTRLREAEATAERFERELHEARTEAAIARHEAERMRQQLDDTKKPHVAVRRETPATEESMERPRKWWQRRR